MTNKRILIGLTILVIFSSCNKTFGQSSTLEEAEKAIAASNAKYWQSYVKNDPNIFINSYAKDACLLEPGKPILCGAEATSDFFKRTYEAGTRNGEFITTEVFGVGDQYVAEVGLLKVFNGAGERIVDGKYLVLWKKTPEGWKMYRDSFSRNLPEKP